MLSVSRLTGVNSIFSELECDPALMQDTLGSSAGITENNIMSYLGLVEQKTDELLTIQAFLRSKVRPCQAFSFIFLLCVRCLTFFFSRQDPEKNYNLRDLPKSLLGQNPEQLQQNISIQPAINTWAMFNFPFSQSYSCVEPILMESVCIGWTPQCGLRCGGVSCR